MMWPVLLLVLSLLRRASAADLSFSSLPKCSLPCLLEALEIIDCSALDFACQCRKSGQLADITQSCLQAKCKMQEVIDLAKIQSKLCNHSVDSRQGYLRNEKIISVSLALFFVAIRMTSKVLIQRRLGLDDWMILVAAHLSIASLACLLISVNYGFGRHLWGFDTSYHFAQALKFFYIEQILYAIITGITKLSILIFFLSIFQQSRSFRIAAKLVFASIACSTTVYIFGLAFQCIPVPLSWDKDIKDGKCLNFNNLAYSGAAITIAQDVATLILPIPQLHTLRVDVYKRIGLAIMFTVGSLGCVASMVRLKFLIDYGISTGEAADPTYTTAPAIAWSGIEAGAAIVCACLPSTRNLYRRIASQLFPRLSLSLSSLNRFRVKQVTSITQNSRPRNESEIELSRTGGEA